MIELTDGFFITPGIETLNAVDYIASDGDPTVFAFDINGIDDTGLVYMTGDEYMSYLIKSEQFCKLYEVAFKQGFNVVWSGVIDKYFPKMLFQLILHYRENLFLETIESNCSSEERFSMLNFRNPFSTLFKHGYKDYIENAYNNLTLEQSVSTICKKLGTNEITVRYGI